jgi:hypothetical protein
MAFLSSFLSGRETVYPDSLRRHLSAFPLLAEVGDAGMKRLLAEANWFGLPGGTPSIISILMRSGTVGSEAQRRLVREQADFLFEPPMPDLGPLDWKSFDRAIAQGYAHTQAMIEKNGVPLTDQWSEGPAVAAPHHGEDDQSAL